MGHNSSHCWGGNRPRKASGMRPPPSGIPRYTGCSKDKSMGEIIHGNGIAMIPDRQVTCPFCKEGGFDRVELKIHLARWWCESFTAIILEDGNWMAYVYIPLDIADHSVLSSDGV